MDRRKVVYIAGPIAGVPEYYKPFEHMEDALTGWGFVALTPTRLPQGLTDAAYMRIDMAMMDTADAVVFLPGWQHSKGATLEHEYCKYTGKPHMHFDGGAFKPVREFLGGIFV